MITYSLSDLIVKRVYILWGPCLASQRFFLFDTLLMFRKTAASYRELEARKSRVQELEKLYMEMSLQKELQVLERYLNPLLLPVSPRQSLKQINFIDQKKGRKRKLREEEIVSPTSKPVYKWRAERKR